MKKILSILLVIAMLCSLVACNDKEEKAENKPEVPSVVIRASDTISFYEGSPLFLADNKCVPLNVEDDSFFPINENGTTYVPATILGNAFDSKCTIEGTTITIELAKDVYIFNTDKKEYTKNGTKTQLENIVIEKNGIVYLPAEEFAKKVLLKEFCQSGKALSISSDKVDEKALDGIKDSIGKVVKAQSFEDIDSAVKDIVREEKLDWLIDSLLGRNRYYNSDLIVGKAEGMRDDAMAPTAENTAVTGESDYTTTNIQIAGVDEDDIVKTDGKYIYVVNNNQGSSKIDIYSVNQGTAAKVNAIDMNNTNECEKILGMYIDNGKLIVISRYYESTFPEKSEDVITEGAEKAVERVEYIGYYADKEFTKLSVYDIQNIENSITCVKTIEVEGSLTSSRKIDNIIYLVTSRYYRGDLEKITKETYLPNICIDNGEKENIQVTDVFIPETANARSFTNILALNIDEVSDYSLQSVMGSSNGAMFMNKENMYLTNTKYKNSGSWTDISRYSIAGTKVNLMANGCVEGNIVNQYSMDEYNGNFRIATTTDDMMNGIYVLGADLQLVGVVHGLAEGERIYSTRFVGEKAYMVTFKTMDPLFVIDLSKPEAPKVLGELKIPGFSDYMHPVGDNLVLGFGMDTQEHKEIGYDGEIYYRYTTNGVKVSLFDVSDPEHPIEKDKISYSWANYSEVNYNPKALMADASRNLFGYILMGDVYNDVYGEYSYKVVPTIIKVEDEKIVEYATLPIDENLFSIGWYGDSGRMLIIDEHLYLVTAAGIQGFALDELEKMN